MSQQHEFIFYDRRYKAVRGYFYPDGKRRRFKLCSFKEAGLDDDGQPTDSSARAEKKRSALFARLHAEVERKLLMEEKERSVQSQGIKQLFDEWIRTFEHDRRTIEHERAPKTLYYYRTTRDGYLKAVGGNHPIADSETGKFSLRNFDKYKSWLKHRGLSSQSINIRIQNLNTFLRWAHERDCITAFTPIDQLRAAKKLPKTLTYEELQALLERIRRLKDTYPREYLRKFFELHERIVMVGMGTGMRLSEIFYCRWDQIDLRKGMIRVEMQTRFSIKEKKEKTIALPKFLLSYLKHVKAQNIGTVWLLDDGKGAIAFSSPDVVSQAFLRHFKKLGFNKRGIKPVHGLRALYANELRKAGVDIFTIKEALGHSDIKVTEGYFSGTEENKRRAAKTLDDFDERLASGRKSIAQTIDLN